MFGTIFLKLYSKHVFQNFTYFTLLTDHPSRKLNEPRMVNDLDETIDLEKTQDGELRFAPRAGDPDVSLSEGDGFNEVRNQHVYR